MTIATNQQVQTFSDTIVRPRCEQLRNLLVNVQSDEASIGDIYSAVTQPSPTWTDSRLDGPPHLLQPSDIAAYNTVIVNLATILGGTTTDAATALSLVQGVQGQWPIVLKACVRQPNG